MSAQHQVPRPKVFSFCGLRPKFERDRVDAVAQAAGRGAVGKNVTKVGVAAGTEDFFAGHAVAAVNFGHHIFLGYRLEKTRPTRAGVEFGIGAEKRQIAADARVNAGLFGVMEGTAEGTLGALATGDLVDLTVPQLGAPLLIGFDHFFHGLHGQTVTHLVE